MKIYLLHSFLSIYTNLLTVGIDGFFHLLFLLIFCFVGTHLILLARIGWLHQTKQETKVNDEPENAENKAPAKPQEPIYYIVERKTKRAKSSYGEPKQFRFK